LNADRAPQLKASVGWLLNSFIGNTMGGIARDAGLSVEEFKKLL